MIHLHAELDPDRWIRSIRLTEGRQPPHSDVYVPLTLEEHEAVSQVPPGLRHGEDGFELPQDDRVAWRAARLKGFDAFDAVTHLIRVRDARAVIMRDLNVPVGHAEAISAEGSPDGAPYPVPGLALEKMTTAHLDDAAALAISSGIYPAACPDGICAPPEAHAWMQLARRIDNPHSWSMVWTFQGRPVQYEVVVLNAARTAGIFSLTVHATRERPRWFHRELEQPVFQALDRLGILRLESRTRSDRPDWIQSLKDNYGATDAGTAGAITRLRFPLDLTVFKGWPARTAVGHDVTTGAVRTWEATEADLPALKALIARDVPATRQAIAVRMVDEWWHLDRAAILLGAKDGTLRYARALRLRKPGVAGLAHLGAMFDEPEQAQVTAHVRQWCRAAGYTTLSSFVPTRLMGSRNVQAQLTRAGSRIKAQRPDWREPFTEVETDV